MTSSGNADGLCGMISTDITELKKAQEQLRLLSGSIMARQEKERAAIARELHDELGQVLTALRMDARMAGRTAERQGCPGRGPGLGHVRPDRYHHRRGEGPGHPAAPRGCWMISGSLTPWIIIRNILANVPVLPVFLNT